MERLAIKGGHPVRDGKIYYGRQWIDEDDIKAVTETLRSDYLTCGPKVDEMEKELAAYTGARYAVAVSNGTAALHHTGIRLLTDLWKSQKMKLKQYA